MSAILTILVAVTNAHPQTKRKPTIDVYSPNFTYADAKHSLSESDLKNSKVIIFRRKPDRNIHATLRNGQYEKHYEVGGESIALEWVKDLTIDSETSRYAIVFYRWDGWVASSSSYGVVQLLRFADGHLQVVQQLVFNTRASEKAGASFDSKTHTLTVRALNEWEHCCPTGLDVVRFQLKEGVLKQIHYETASLE